MSINNIEETKLLGNKEPAPRKCAACCQRCDKFIALGTTGLIVGIFLVIVAILAEFVVTPSIHPRIIQTILVDSQDSPGYTMWQTNNYEGSPPLWNIFTFYNLTNPQEVLAGQEPHYNEIGPFYYQLIKERFDVVFSDNGNIVTFNEYDRYIFNESLSVLPDNVVILNMNPAYVGVMQKTGGEFQLLVAFTGPALGHVMDFLTGQFVNYTIAFTSPAIMEDQVISLVSMTNESYFLATWANSTSIPSNEWKGMVISNGTIPSCISVSSAQRLFNASVENSLLDKTRTSTDLWSDAISGNSQSATILTNTFNITSNQLTYITNWLRFQFQPIYVYANLSTKYKVSNLSDLGWLQWGEGKVSKTSVTQLYPQWLNYSISAEFALFWDQPSDKFTVNQSKYLFEGPYGLFQATNVGIFAAEVVADNTTGITANWGIPSELIADFTAYFAEVTDNIATPYIHQLFNEGGSLFTARTVRQWLFNATDPLLLLLQPENPTCSLLKNFTSEADARQRLLPSSTWTGKDDINKISQYISWQGQSVITGIYPINLTISGATEWGQFKPFLGYYDVLGTFNENYVRQMTLQPVGQLEHKGITAHRYQVDNTTWSPNEQFAMDIQGFANMDGLQHAPIYQSNPHMMLAEQQWWGQLQGVAAPDPLQDLSWVDVEPTTGKVVNVKKMLQANIYIPQQTSWFDLWNAGLRKQMMYPLMYAAEESILTDAQADQLKNDLYLIQEILSLAVPIASTVGGVLTFVGLVSLVFGIRRKLLRAEHQYQDIN